MSRVSREVQERALLELQEEGADAQSIADNYGIQVNTLLRWRNERDAAPDGIAPPPMVGAKRGRKAKVSPRPITEETAGQLVAGIFAMVAMADGPWWFLTDDERKALAAPAADSLRILPGNVADAINTYSAPAVFGTTLFAIVQHKMKLRLSIQQRGKNVVSMQRVQPPRAAPQEPPGQPVPPSAPVEPPTATIAEQEAALEAARGSLADAPDEMEMNLQ